MNTPWDTPSTGADATRRTPTPPSGTSAFVASCYIGLLAGILLPGRMSSCISPGRRYGIPAGRTRTSRMATSPKLDAGSKVPHIRLDGLLRSRIFGRPGFDPETTAPGALGRGPPHASIAGGCSCDGVYGVVEDRPAGGCGEPFESVPLTRDGADLRKEATVFRLGTPERDSARSELSACHPARNGHFRSTSWLPGPHADRASGRNSAGQRWTALVRDRTRALSLAGIFRLRPVPFMPGTRRPECGGKRQWILGRVCRTAQRLRARPGRPDRPSAPVRTFRHASSLRGSPASPG